MHSAAERLRRHRRSDPTARLTHGHVACDSLVALGSATADGSVLFAKNSDRDPPTECQRLIQRPRQTHTPGTKVRCQYVEIEQAPETARLIGAQPYWLWGFEHGLNEHGVAIGNHTVFTKDGLAGHGLIGMDLVRLGLERGTSATGAVEVITSLIERHGQGGSGYVDKDWPYHNSFLVADRGAAYVLEASDRRWALKRVADVASESNHLSIGTDWTALADGTIEHAITQGWWSEDRDGRFDFAAAYGDTTVVPDVISRGRHARTCALLADTSGTVTPASLQTALRDHYASGTVYQPGRAVDDPEAYSVCMHTPPVGTTTASMVARLGPPDEPLVCWASLGSPCVGAFLPYYVAGELPAALGRGDATPRPDSPWWRFHELLDLVARDFARYGPIVREHWSAFEAEVEVARPAAETAARAARSAARSAAPLTRFMAANVTALGERLDAVIGRLRA